MKTRKPLILTACIAAEDLERFNRLRAAHFPPDGNVLPAHLTMFHRLPGEYEKRICNHLSEIAGRTNTIAADVDGLRHLGAGVAFSIASSDLHKVRATLRASFASWLGPQDVKTWQPHITIQNKSPKDKADALWRHLSEGFAAYSIRITGLQLWEYLGGPWKPFQLYAIPIVLGLTSAADEQEFLWRQMQKVAGIAVFPVRRQPLQDWQSGEPCSR
ncbi:2'-5' RNA ligase family protein [Rhizobium helianthi]|uniref:2'-5' RNA ligase family protein n=1 Tax=Rhizobium helianthi TaxID=1132695 RepID=A0ABW4M790_9HYPH